MTNNFAEGWVDIHNDELMVSLGIRVAKLPENMLNTCPKTPEERKALRKCRRHSGNADMHFHTVPQKEGTWGNLIIQLKGNKTFDTSTYSTQCFDYDIPYIISRYSVPKKKGKEEYMESVVRKVSWNGRTIKANYNN